MLPSRTIFIIAFEYCCLRVLLPSSIVAFECLRQQYKMVAEALEATICFSISFIYYCLREPQATITRYLRQQYKMLAEALEATICTSKPLFYFHKSLYAIANSGSKLLLPSISASFFFLLQPCICFSR